MRADMFKVIVERPRLGSRQRSVKLGKDRIFDRKYVGLNRHVHECPNHGKALNENLAPLVRYLHRQVGRRWDDVFSEICERLDTGSTVKMHVRQHLDDFVVSRIGHGRHGELVHDGFVLDPGRSHGWHGKLFVDPDDGILKDRVRFWRDRGREPPASYRNLQNRWG